MPPDEPLSEERLPDAPPLPMSPPVELLPREVPLAPMPADELPPVP